MVEAKVEKINLNQLNLLVKVLMKEAEVTAAEGNCSSSSNNEVFLWRNQQLPMVTVWRIKRKARKKGCVRVYECVCGENFPVRNEWGILECKS